jgi:hypothetical protein
MKNNNKLTLKALKHELDLIKASKAQHTMSKIVEKQSLYQRSSMFYLWLFTGVLGYIHKIPIIGRVITLLSLWYGKSNWWKLLVYSRKLFIILNAIIGVFVVFKTTGFTPDLLMHNIIMMGHTYLEIFTNLTKRLFNWFLELFDSKIVPKLPGSDYKPFNGSGNGVVTDYKPYFNPVSATHQPLPSLRESYSSLFNISVDPTPTSWYKDYTTWLWIGGLVLSVGALYFGYKFIVDPTFVDSMNNNSGPSTVTPSPIDPTGGENDISLMERVSKGIIDSTKYIGNGIKKLNPIYWLTGTTDANSELESLLERQHDVHTYDRRFYPFTPLNPCDSWFDKLRISWLGETVYENSNRLREKAIAWRAMDVSNTYPTTPLGPLSTISTPRLGNVGLGTRFVSSTGLMETLEAGSSYNDVWTKFASLPSTPTIVPTSLPDINLADLNSVTPSWNTHLIDQNELSGYSQKLSELKPKLDPGFSYAKVAAKTITEKAPFVPNNDNKFNILETDVNI